MPTERRWKSTDILYRGDAYQGVAIPTPSSRIGVVEHILYLGGAGRDTPFTSTTEASNVAEHFAGDGGAVWSTTVQTAGAEGAGHIDRDQLLSNLRGFGRGKAKWTNRWEVAQAAANVVRWSEHLLDWTDIDQDTILVGIPRTFRRARRR